MRKYNTLPILFMLFALCLSTSALSNPVEKASSLVNNYTKTKAAALPNHLSAEQTTLVRHIFEQVKADCAEADRIPFFPSGMTNPYFSGPDAKKRLARADVARHRRDKSIADAAVKLRALGPEVIPELVHGLYYNSPSVSDVCSSTLTKFGKQSVEPILEGYVHYGDQAVLLNELIRPFGPSAYEPLTAALSNPNPKVREAAMSTLSSICCESQVYQPNSSTKPSAATIEAVRHSLNDPLLQFHGARMLWTFGTTAEDIAALERVCGDRNAGPETRLTALKGIDGIGRRVTDLVDAVADALIRQLRGSNLVDIRYAAASFLGDFKSVRTKARSAWMLGLLDSSKEVRERCSAALAGKL